MYKKINFSELGGMPFDAQTLEFMQVAYTDISSCLTAMIGDNVIVAGCIVSGDSVSAGWVIVGGELLPFAASKTGVLKTFIIQELKTSLVFENAQQKQIEITRFAQFGSNDNSIAWNSLTRLPSYATIASHIKSETNPHKVTKNQIGLGNLPNAISDDASVNKSDVIASTAAVNSAMASANNIVASGRVALNVAANYVHINLPQPLANVEKCQLVVGVFYQFIEDNPDARVLYTYRPDFIETYGISHDNVANTTQIRMTYDRSKMGDSPLYKYYAIYSILKIG